MNARVACAAARAAGAAFTFLSTPSAEGGASYLEMAIAAESFAVIAEALYLWGLGLRGRPGAGRFAAIAIPFASSLAANFASVTLALASRAALGRP